MNFTWFRNVLIVLMGIFSTYRKSVTNRKNWFWYNWLFHQENLIWKIKNTIEYILWYNKILYLIITTKILDLVNILCAVSKNLMVMFAEIFCEANLAWYESLNYQHVLLINSKVSYKNTVLILFSMSSWRVNLERS